VLILHAIQELKMGGAERIVLALTAAAQAQGHDVAVAAAPGPLVSELDAPVFELPLLERRVRRLPAAISALRTALRKARPDVVHCHNPGLAGAVGMATLRGKTTPALVSVHGVADEDYGRAARVLRLSGLPVVACGPAVEGGLREAGLAPLATIPNGVSPPPPPADREALATELGIPPDRPLLLTVGRLMPVKNQALAISALAQVPDATLLLAGVGPLLESLRARAEEAGVGNRVVFGGLRPDARALMGAADAVLLPSHGEGLPLVALETLAAGTPLVATDVRGLRELAADGAVLLASHGDPRALAAAIRRVLEDRALADELERAGLALARRHSEERMAAAYLALYERLAAPE
jgi:glycosyltransferase involved in cell wall biosynthesis